MATYQVEIWGEFDSPHTMNDLDDVYEFLSEEFLEVRDGEKEWEDVFDPGYTVDFTEV